MNYEEIYQTPLNGAEIDILFHSLGVKTQIERRKYIIESSRNYFVGKENEDIKHLIELGFMKKIRQDYFVVTKKGMVWVQAASGRELQVRDFEDVYE